MRVYFIESVISIWRDRFDEQKQLIWWTVISVLMVYDQLIQLSIQIKKDDDKNTIKRKFQDHQDLNPLPHGSCFLARALPSSLGIDPIGSRCSGNWGSHGVVTKKNHVVPARIAIILYIQ